MVNESSSLRERLVAIETIQTHTYEVVKELRDHVKKQNGRIDDLERWVDRRGFVEKLGIGAISIVGGGGILWILKMLGAF